MPLMLRHLWSIYAHEEQNNMCSNICKLMNYEVHDNNNYSVNIYTCTFGCRNIIVFMLLFYSQLKCEIYTNGICHNSFLACKQCMPILFYLVNILFMNTNGISIESGIWFLKWQYTYQQNAWIQAYILFYLC